MDRKLITLNFSMEQVCNDILARCYVVSQGMVDEAQKDIRANIESPDSDETRSIINRAVTEAIANIKLAAQRYQTTGRVEDNNNLERLVKGIRKYAYTDNEDGTWTEVVTTIIDGEENETTATVNKAGKDREETIYETVTLKLEIPNWNVAVTDALKSHCHRYIVDYVMSQFLMDQFADKAGTYGESATADYNNIKSDLLSRDNYTLRRPSFT
ncbi:hypothetical protein [Segatella hominis]|uniref:hypothetical protein n=1 Tax=Segatella hominis TaxID=2518605 RepID=UPI00205D65E9|nr:MAG TPA: hypothetical protein [Caudoviricetes sp.]